MPLSKKRSSHPASKAINRLTSNASQVIALRLSLLPWQWLFDPAGAQRETRRMLNEKSDALVETQIAIAMLPLTIWLDLISTGKWLTPDQLYRQASKSATRDVMRPAQSRVSGNLKRLGVPARQTRK